MGMFDTYDNLVDNYIPNNIKPCPPKPCDPLLDPTLVNKPFENYDKEGKLIGYWWNYGDTVNLEFNITGEVVVEKGDIVYTAKGQEPTALTAGKVGTKAFNIVDEKSWTLVSLSEGLDYLNYNWQEDSEYVVPNKGTTNVYVTAEDFLKNTQITVQLYNFRMEQIAMKTFEGSSTVVFEIDKELSKKMVKSNYYCTVTIWNTQALNKTILSQENCTLTVK